jgi:hypothetical protein
MFVAYLYLHVNIKNFYCLHHFHLAPQQIFQFISPHPKSLSEREGLAGYITSVCVTSKSSSVSRLLISCALPSFTITSAGLNRLL